MADPVPAAVPAAAPAAVPVPVSEPQARTSKNKPLILVVEDDAKMRRVLEMLLSVHWTVETAADARAAMKATRERAPDLVLTDLLLPGMDGYDFLRQLRTEAGTRTLPVIVISGLTEEADRLRALEAGANDYLIKPFSERELMLRVTTHLEMAFLRREAALQENEVQLRSILEGALDAVVGMDAGGRVIDWNRQAQTTFGWTREEALGRRLSELIIPPEVREAHERGLAGSLETEGGPLLNRRVEVEGQKKDGTRIPIELAITVVKGWGLFRFNAFCRDISDRKLADAERNRLLEEAREANRMKDEFLAMLSHELRTPLSAIVGWAHMLRTGGLDEATVARAIETIDRNAKVQNQLIEDILDVSRIVAGKFHLDMRSADLVRIVETACDTLAPAAATKGVELRQDLDPQVVPCCPVIGDPDRLQQVVWNLLTNAIKFTPRGGVVTIQVRRHDESSEFEISVRDTGMGIAPHFLPHLFERFRQAGSGSRRAGGLGLGLSIVRHIVEMHGGTVAATSGGEGQGSVFKVRLPIIEATADGPRVPCVSREEAGLEDSPRLDGVKVLVVEDEADARHLLAAVLQKRGALVFMAATGAEALELLQRERPDVLLSDIALQDQDGYDLIRKVRSLPQDKGGRIPAAALTGYGRLEDRMRALSAGFQLHAAKPVDSAELIAVVASLAGKTAR